MPPLLFASLSKTKAFSKANSNSQSSSAATSASSLAFPPTAIQFHSTKSIDLSKLQVIHHEETHDDHFAPLNYHTATIPGDLGNSIGNNLGTATGTGTATTTNNKQAEIGIWNCHITPQSIAPATLLSACTYSPQPQLNYNNSRSLPTFVLTLDLHPHKIDQIHPILHTMLSNILQYAYTYDYNCSYSQMDNNANASTDNDTNMNAGTTSSAKLAQCQFGKAPLAEDNHTDNIYNLAENRGPQKGSLTLLNIIICGILPNKHDIGNDNDNDHDNDNGKQHMTYKDKQAFNLVSYHLQKLASEISCTLCFVNAHGSSKKDLNEDGQNQDDEASEKGNSHNEANGDDPFTLTQKGLSVAEFAMALKRLCVGADELEDGNGNGDGDGDGVQDDDEEHKGMQGEGQGGDGTRMQSDVEEEHQHQHPHQQPSLYGPFDHDADLINSVLLRGAGCPGVWNANTDSLWVALPPSPGVATATTTILDSKEQAKESNGNAVNANANANANAKVGGDEDWLGKLAESVSAYVTANVGNGNTSGAGDKSVRSSMDQTTRTSSQHTVATKRKVVRKKPTVAGDKKGDSQDVQDFFAGLLNK